MSYTRQTPQAFFIALVIVTIPLWLLENYKASEMSWYYIGIIALGYILLNNPGIAAELSYFQSQMRAKGK